MMKKPRPQIPIHSPGTRVTDDTKAYSLSIRTPHSFKAAQDLLMQAEKYLKKGKWFQSKKKKEKRLEEKIYQLDDALRNDGFNLYKIDEKRSSWVLIEYLSLFSDAIPNWQPEYMLLNTIIFECYRYRWQEAMVSSFQNVHEVENPKSENIVDQLKPFYYKTIDVLQEIDGKLKHQYEAGLFIISIAIVGVLSSNSKNPKKIADFISSKWLNFLSTTENVDKAFLVQDLQKKYVIYKDLFWEMRDPLNNDDQSSSKTTQFMWELHRNCTGKKSPDDFLTMMLASGQIITLSLEIIDKLSDHY